MILILVINVDLIKSGVTFSCSFTIESLINAIHVSLQGCVKVWDISQASGKNLVSTLDCLVSSHCIDSYQPFYELISHFMYFNYIQYSLITLTVNFNMCFLPSSVIIIFVLVACYLMAELLLLEVKLVLLQYGT